MNLIDNYVLHIDSFTRLPNAYPNQPVTYYKAIGSTIQVNSWVTYADLVPAILSRNYVKVDYYISVNNLGNYDIYAIDITGYTDTYYINAYGTYVSIDNNGVSYHHDFETPLTMGRLSTYNSQVIFSTDNEENYYTINPKLDSTHGFLNHFSFGSYVITTNSYSTANLDYSSAENEIYNFIRSSVVDVDTAYYNGYDVGYNNGYDVGYQNGYDYGYDVGNLADDNATAFTYIGQAIGGVADIMNIQVLPNMTIGLLVSIPLTIALIKVVFNLVKK